MGIISPVLQGLGAAIGLYEQRHRVLSENVANAETPGYRARELDFGSALTDAFETGQGRELEAVVDRRAVVKIDRNSVDVDTAMTKLSDNALRILALSEILARKYAGLKRVIGES